MAVVGHVRRLAAQRVMRAPAIVRGDELSDSLTCLRRRRVVVRIYLVVLDAAPETLDDHIVQGTAVEFGSKISLTVADGFARLHRISWKAYDEGGSLPEQVESYRGLHECYPASVHAPKSTAPGRIAATAKSKAYA